MTTDKTAAAEFRYITGLLAIKTGAAVVASDELTPAMQSEAMKTTWDELFSRLLGMAIVLGIWHKP